MTEDIPKFKGSKEEVMVEVEGLALRFVDLINRADEYDLEKVDAAGVWFVIGQAYSLMHHAKRLLKGEPSKDVARDWRAMMDVVTVSEKTLRELADRAMQMWDSGFSGGCEDWPELCQALLEASPLVHKDFDIHSFLGVPQAEEEADDS